MYCVVNHLVILVLFVHACIVYPPAWMNSYATNQSIVSLGLLTLTADGGIKNLSALGLKMNILLFGEPSMCTV